MLFFAKFIIAQCACINDGATLGLVALLKKKQKMNWVLQLAFVLFLFASMSLILPSFCFYDLYYTITVI